MANGLLGDLSSRALGTGGGECMFSVSLLWRASDQKIPERVNRQCGRGGVKGTNRGRIYVLLLLVTHYALDLDVPVGSTAPCTSRIPTGTGRRDPARVRAGASPWSSPTPLITSAAPCTCLPTARTGIWIVRAGGRRLAPCWTRRLHSHLSWNISILDSRHIRS